ncbi:MAG: anthranilate phosphoribosyltransferase [Gammaproteobacteria bacterium AqS3]|nr:anthranilate phosphoribosyltransferase [Gammaproteobacteria bacterium AqS3]
MDLAGCIGALRAGENLSGGVVQDVVAAMMRGEVSDEDIGGFLLAMRDKGEHPDELAGAARAMRAACASVEVPGGGEILDTCGTGGSGAGMFNVSTASAFVAAAAGLRVAKHGNRASSSVCGSADVLEAAGLRLDLTPEQVGACIAEVGVGFLFAQVHHQAMRNVMPVRRALGVRTMFNLLGPLTNPAGAVRQVLGVPEARWVEPISQVLERLGAREALVLHSDDGADEISPAAPTRAVHLVGGEHVSCVLDPADVGISGSLEDVRIDGVESGAAMFSEALRGAPGTPADALALNAGAALWIGGACPDWASGVVRARELMADGSAWAHLQRLVEFARQL